MKKNKLITTLIAMLVLLNVASLLYGQSSAQQVSDLRSIVAELPKQPVVYVGKDGTTPKKGIDYTDGKNGADGINAISFSKTVVQDVPLIGQNGAPGKDGIDGQNGKDAPTQEIRINPSTGDLETKQSDGWFWNILVTCDKLNTCTVESN